MYKVAALLLAAAILVGAGWYLGIQSSTSNNTTGDFNLIFQYGINKLDTFKGMYTKDMVQDPAVTIPMVLTVGERRSIQSKMKDIGFFNYPDQFIEPEFERQTPFQPSTIYNFEVVSESGRKKLKWLDGYYGQSEQAKKLRELIQYIANIIESKPEYQQLPPARGAYQ